MQASDRHPYYQGCMRLPAPSLDQRQGLVFLEAERMRCRAFSQSKEKNGYQRKKMDADAKTTDANSRLLFKCNLALKRNQVN